MTTTLPLFDPLSSLNASNNQTAPPDPRLPPIQSDSLGWAKDVTADIQHVEAVTPGTKTDSKPNPMETAEREVLPPGAYVPDPTADGGMRAPTGGNGGIVDSAQQVLTSAGQTVKEYLPASVGGLLRAWFTFHNDSI
jgi:hypothetical protein